MNTQYSHAFLIQNGLYTNEHILLARGYYYSRYFVPKKALNRVAKVNVSNSLILARWPISFQDKFISQDYYLWASIESFLYDYDTPTISFKVGNKVVTNEKDRITCVLHVWDSIGISALGNQ